MRQIPYTMMKFACFEKTVVALSDSVVSVINKNPGKGAGEILKELGPKGVWKGLVARIIMIGTLTALQWFIYDGVKVALNLPRPPPPAMPESLRKKLAAQQA